MIQKLYITESLTLPLFFYFLSTDLILFSAAILISERKRLRTLPSFSQTDY